MSLKSLHHVLGTLESQEGWQERRELQRLIQCWPEVVGLAVTAQTRPISIQRGVLSVATSSSAWAQNLMFERQRLLEKLNTRLEKPLTDIRFSTAHWQSRRTSSSVNADSQPSLWQQHPSRIKSPAELDPRTPVNFKGDPQAAFQHWAKTVRLQLQNLPRCPRCQCPAPSGELERWSVCALCAAKQW
ncbi:MAG: DciA family protein [Leptolyngbyaceae bacterium]|nr:DciA family protein [Leptolyngbyaceae bacterium]